MAQRIRLRIRLRHPSPESDVFPVNKMHLVIYPEEDRAGLLEWVRKQYYEATIDTPEFRFLWNLLDKLVRESA